MSYKTALVVCALALIQSISAQCIGPYNGLAAAEVYGLGAPYAFAGAPFAEAAWAGPYGIAPCETAFGPWGTGLGPAALAASNGAGLAVTSASPIAPTGVSMVSENAYEGALAVAGAIPFLGAVALDGALPTVGAGAVTYGCGNGNVAVLTEDFTAAGFGAPFAFDGLPGPAYGYDGLIGPYGYGIAGPYGCDGIVGPGYGPYGYGGLYY